MRIFFNCKFSVLQLLDPMMKRSILQLTLSLFMLFISSSFVTQEPPSQSEADRFFSEQSFLLLYSISIENWGGGRIIAYYNDVFKRKPKLLGRVLKPATLLNYNAFYASTWSDAATVSGSAVNSIHIRLSSNPEIGKGAVLTIYPKQLFNQDIYGKPVKKRPPSIIYTDIVAGHSIFGGNFSVPLGSQIRIKRKNALITIDPFYSPSIGDRIIIDAIFPNKMPRDITFQNRVGGKVFIRYRDGKEFQLAAVAKRVEGVGQFLGGRFAEVSAIRASHPGVIDISTSPAGDVGGFQIIPEEQLATLEMGLRGHLPQYLILRQPDGNLAGTAPLFKLYLYPQSLLENGDIGGLGLFLGNLRSFARFKGEDSFSKFRNLIGRRDSALKGLEDIRIIFPVTKGWRPAPSEKTQER